MISQAFTQNTFKIMSLFSLSPGSRFNRNEIKGKTNLNNVPLDEGLVRLLNSKILKKEGNYYSLDFENEYSQKFTDICSRQHKQMKSLPLSAYFLLADFVFSMSLHKGVETYLFGSYSKLIFTGKSDIDIAILEPKINRAPAERIIRKLERAYGTRIQAHYFDKKAFYRSKKDPLVREITKNGIRLI